MYPKGNEKFSEDSTALGSADHLEVLPHPMGELMGNAVFQALVTCLVSVRVLTRLHPGTTVVQ